MVIVINFTMVLYNFLARVYVCMCVQDTAVRSTLLQDGNYCPDRLVGFFEDRPVTVATRAAEVGTLLGSVSPGWEMGQRWVNHIIFVQCLDLHDQ